MVNSLNYGDGDGPDSRTARLMPVIRERGAAVVALTIDERGQARTAEWKLEVTERLIADLTGNWGVTLSEEMQLHPEQSTDAIVSAHTR